MADRIIYNLDTNGYLQGRLEDICSAPDAGEEELALAQRALALVQKLDPPGVGARDLRECLLLQLMPGAPLLRATADADRRTPGRPGAQPLAGDFPPHRLFDRVDPEERWKSCGN